MVPFHLLKDTTTPVITEEMVWTSWMRADFFRFPDLELTTKSLRWVVRARVVSVSDSAAHQTNLGGGTNGVKYVGLNELDGASSKGFLLDEPRYP